MSSEPRRQEVVNVTDAAVWSGGPRSGFHKERKIRDEDWNHFFWKSFQTHNIMSIIQHQTK